MVAEAAENRLADTLSQQCQAFSSNKQKTNKSNKHKKTGCHVIYASTAAASVSNFFKQQTQQQKHVLIL